MNDERIPRQLAPHLRELALGKIDGINDAVGMDVPAITGILRLDCVDSTANAVPEMVEEGLHTASEAGDLILR